MKNSHQITALCISVILGLGISMLSLSLAGVAFGSDNGSHRKGGPIIGLASNPVTCLAVGRGLPDTVSASGVVRLNWSGRVERARLSLRVSGAEAAHTIKVNGQTAASVPVYPDGQLCRYGEPFYLDISPEVLEQGDNVIEITNDGRAGDSWSAADIRLEVFGDVSTAAADVPGQFSATSTTSSTQIIAFVNTYDGDPDQEAIIQIPDGYTGNNPTPLMIALHGRTGVMESMITLYGSAANASTKRWLLASPQMHGSWPIPADCYTDPIGPGCEPNDELLLTRPGAFAYASLESQYDVIGTLKYMVDHYNVKLDQIYLVGDSMGSQIATVMAAKYPHLFAAVFDNKGPTNMVQWYSENNSEYKRTMRKECHIGGVLKLPSENPFCYQRRSSLNFASNYLHTPISMTHSISDVSVPITHSRDLRNAINTYGPDRLASIYEDTLVGPTCPPQYHCYDPDHTAVLNFFAPFTLNNNPTHIDIATDESKSYYWLNIAQTGGAHWSQVEVTYYAITKTVVAVISDTNPLTLGFNLGSVPIAGAAGIGQPGMGLPAATYAVVGGGNNYQVNYASGYLTVTLNTTGQYSLTISAVRYPVYLPIVTRNQ
jgi:pimeloyl-ACP methyl ester carboxylesterase